MESVGDLGMRDKKQGFNSKQDHRTVPAKRNCKLNKIFKYRFVCFFRNKYQASSYLCYSSMQNACLNLAPSYNNNDLSF